MAIDLKAVFRVQDKGTSTLRRIMQQTSKVSQATEKLTKSNQQAAKASNTFRDANGRLRDSMGRYVSETNKASTASKRFSTSLNGVRVGSSGISASLGGMQSALFGLVGAYVTAQSAAAAFNATIGAAARYEQSEVAVHAIFNDSIASDAYLAMVDKMAIDSPLLNSGEMLGSSKTLVAMTKNVKELGKAWSIIERLMVLDPTQGTDGAAFALKEMWQGDALAMIERFGLSKKDLNRIKKLEIPQQIAEINKLLDGMGITQSTVNAMGATTLGYWAQIQERVDKFMRTIGGDGNNKLGKALEGVVKALDDMDVDKVARQLGDGLGEVVNKAIDVGKWLWKWREPLAYATAAVGVALTAFIGIGAIVLLANPIGLIAAGLAAASVGMYALYQNSEPVRNAVSGVVDKAKELIGAFKSGGTGGLLDALLGDGTSEKVTAFISGLETALMPGIERVKLALSTAWTFISTVFTTAWTIIGPIVSVLANWLQIIGGIAIIVFNNIIAPALQFIMQLFSTLWSIVQPILSLLAAMLQVVSAAMLALWQNVLAPLVNFILTGVKNAFDFFTQQLEQIQGLFDGLSGKVQAVYDKIVGFAEYLKGVKLPDWLTSGVSTAVNFVGKAVGAGSAAKGHYSGLSNVPYDGYNARLHKNERVLTAKENREYTAAKEGGGGFGGGVTITGNHFTVREEADIDRIAMALAKQIEKEALRIG